MIGAAADEGRERASGGKSDGFSSLKLRGWKQLSSRGVVLHGRGTDHGRASVIEKHRKNAQRIASNHRYEAFRRSGSERSGYVEQTEAYDVGGELWHYDGSI